MGRVASAGFLDPEAAEISRAAFAMAWTRVQGSGSVMAAAYRALATQELLAKRIIATAQHGEKDLSRLVRDALDHLERTTPIII